jgi:hypothetical protein
MKDFQQILNKIKPKFRGLIEKKINIILGCRLIYKVVLERLKHF